MKMCHIIMGNAESKDVVSCDSIENKPFLEGVYKVKYVESVESVESVERVSL
jgi:hypothetical protein